MSDLDRSMHGSLWVLVAHTSFIEGSHTTKNTASVQLFRAAIYQLAFALHKEELLHCSESPARLPDESKEC